MNKHISHPTLSSGVLLGSLLPSMSTMSSISYRCSNAPLVRSMNDINASDLKMPTDSNSIGSKKIHVHVQIPTDLRVILLRVRIVQLLRLTSNIAVLSTQSDLSEAEREGLALTSRTQGLRA